jgi:hypothetical protein
MTRITHGRRNEKNRICSKGHMKTTLCLLSKTKSIRLLLVEIRISNVNVRVLNKFNISGL